LRPRLPTGRWAAPIATAAVCATATICAAGAMAPPASAFNPVKPICDVAGFVSGLLGKACSVVQHGGQLITAGKKLLGGHVGSAIKAVAGIGGSAASTASTALGLAALVAWVRGGARYALNATADVLARTTSPQLGSTWFSSTYWRVAGIAGVLTLPFLFAAVIQAILHSDLMLLGRALACLPLAMLGVGIAAPLTTLLLSASDQLSAVVSSAAANASGHFLHVSAEGIGGLALISASPFIVFIAALLTVTGAIFLWLELLVREAAVYVIVLLLPLAFAALVWPARRIWAVRAVELLVALILSKFAMVAVLSLGGTALEHTGHDTVSGLIAGFVLLVMGAFAPWALLRLLPLTELASGAAAAVHSDARAIPRRAEPAEAGARQAHDRLTTERTPGSRTNRDEGMEAADAVRSRLDNVSADAVTPDGAVPTAPGATPPQDPSAGTPGTPPAASATTPAPASATASASATPPPVPTRAADSEEFATIDLGARVARFPIADVLDPPELDPPALDPSTLDAPTLDPPTAPPPDDEPL
jgi:hypothetical protein